MKTQENPSKQSTNRNTHPYYHTQPIEEKINYLRSIFSPENEDECILLTVDIYSTNSIDEIINYIKLQPLNTPEERLTMIDILSTIFQTTNAINSLSPWLNTIKLREFINDKCKEIWKHKCGYPEFLRIYFNQILKI